MALSQGAAERLSIVIDIGKTIFHYGFIPTVLYMGFQKGADPGMPELSITNLFW
ncbi:mitochondrial import receptor subunit TOM7 homolog [Agrilus planipennis]|uniref:Mitochondrial import receptor subunit TOM7 homolog n=1 Tax=Agrilus planipennis TaxID=224129 RepID=A0A1W4XJA2_AGRPL|nr:mitochondrial import receptor subunit TOM7 homolog [Agrilus planipennis]